MCVQVHGGGSRSVKEWTKVKNSRLITEYNCPNFHFLETNLVSPGAQEFFYTSIPLQIQHLKLSSCHVTSDSLLRILSLCSKSLVYLEILDFSRFESSSSTEVFPGCRQRSGIAFRSLTTLILDDSRSQSSANFPGNKKVQLSSAFLQEVLGRVETLQTICFHGWNPKTCSNIIKTLGSTLPKCLEAVQFLEIACVVDDKLEARKQYAFLKHMEWVHLPNLRNLEVSFDLSFEACPVENYLDKALIERLTNGLAVLVEGANKTLVNVVLLNCPVSNGVFRNGVRSFPKLCSVTTTGCLITKLDDDDNNNPISEVTSEVPLRQRREGQHTLAFPVISESSVASTSDESQPEIVDLTTLTRVDVYLCACGLLLFVAFVHFGLRYLFGTFQPWTLDNIEAIIFAIVIFCVFKGSELRTLWLSNDTCIL